MKKNKLQLKFTSLLFIILIVFSPFSALKLGFFGLPELAIIIIFIILFFSKDILFKNNIFIFYWTIFIVLTLLGLFNNYVIKNHVSGTLNSMVFDFLAYFFVIFSLLTISNLFDKLSYYNLLKLLRYVYCITAVIIISLYFYAYFISSTLFGFELLYYQMFRPFATNIHHVSLFLAPFPFIGLKLFFIAKKSIQKLAYFVSIILLILISINTGSSKIILSLIFGGLIIFFGLIKKLPLSGKSKKIIFFNLVFISLVILVFNIETVYQYTYKFFVDNDAGSARNQLYYNSITKIIASPLFGYGPGAHSYILYPYAANYDAHQTFLTAALQGGILAFVTLTVFSYKLFYSFKKDLYFLAAYISFFVYSLGGDVLRRFSSWILLFLLFTIINKNKESKDFYQK